MSGSIGRVAIFDKQTFCLTATDFGLAMTEWLQSEEFQSLNEQALDDRLGRVALIDGDIMSVRSLGQCCRSFC